MRIDPLDQSLRGARFLNDRGISQAIDFGFIQIEPHLDLQKDTTRLQPSTLDIKIKAIGQ